MKSIIVMFYFLLVGYSALACPIYNDIESFHYSEPFLLLNTKSNQKNEINPSLSDLWAYELVGIDLINIENQDPPYDSQLAICDDNGEYGAEDHGLKIQSIIESNLFKKKPDVVPYFKCDKQNIGRSLNTIKNNGNLKYVNFSRKALEPLVEKGFYNYFDNLVFVKSAGNHWLDTEFSYLKELEGFTKQTTSLVIGSLSHLGVSAYYSEESPFVDFLSPSGRGVPSCYSKEEKSVCGSISGTSAAAGFASQAVSIVSMYLPNLNFSQLYSLIDNTKIPTIEAKRRPGRNGSGLINNYKLFRVAQKIYNLCENDNSCINQQILNKENYKFPYNELEQTYIDWGNDCLSNKDLGDSQNSCLNKKAKTLGLRRLALLNPENKIFWNMLSCVSHREKYFANSYLFLSLGERNDYQKYFKEVESQNHRYGFSPAKYLFVKLGVVNPRGSEYNLDKDSLEVGYWYNWSLLTPDFNELAFIYQNSHSKWLKQSILSFLKTLGKKGTALSRELEEGRNNIFTIPSDSLSQ